MSRKHYKALAGILRAARESFKHSDEAVAAIEYVANQLSGYLAGENPGFNVQKFEEACKE